MKHFFSRKIITSFYEVNVYIKTGKCPAQWFRDHFNSYSGETRYIDKIKQCAITTQLVVQIWVTTSLYINFAITVIYLKIRFLHIFKVDRLTIFKKV